VTAMKKFSDFQSAMAAIKPKRRRKKLPAALDIAGRQPPSPEAKAVAREARRTGLVRLRNRLKLSRFFCRLRWKH
jgi:hypothetical protein